MSGNLDGGQDNFGTMKRNLGCQGIGAGPMQARRFQPGFVAVLATQDFNHRQLGRPIFPLRIKMKLDSGGAFAHILGQEQVVGQVIRRACCPARQAGEEIAHFFPFGDGPGSAAVGLAGVAQNAACPGLPGGHHGRTVFIQGDRGEIGAGAEIAKIVAADRQRLGKRLPCQSGHAGCRLDGRELVQKGATGDDESVLGEEPRQFLRVIRKEAAAAAQPGNVFQKLAVLVGLFAQTDHAHGNAGFLAFLDDLHIAAGLFGVAGVGKKDDVLGAGLGRLDHLGGGQQGLVNVDAAPHRLDAQNLVAHRPLVGDRAQLLDHMGDGIDRQDAELVGGPEQVEDLDGAEIGQIHLDLAAPHGGRHAAGAVESDDNGQGQLAVLFTQLHGDGKNRLEGGFEKAARSVGISAARHHQARSRVLDPGGQGLHAGKTDLFRRHIFQNHRAVARQALEGPGTIFRSGDVHFQAAG